MTRTKSPGASSLLKALAAISLVAGLVTAGPQQQTPRRHTAAAAGSAGQSKKSLPAKPAPPDASLVQASRENTIGLAVMDRRDYAAALGHFQTACVLNPASDAGCLNMGIAFLAMRRFDDARQVLAKSAELDPQNPRTWYNLALLARATGDAAGARDNFQKVAALDPDDPGTQYFLGYLATQDQKYDLAVAAFRRAIEIDPLDISAEFGLSQAEQDLGHADAAKSHLERFQRLSAEKLGRPVRFLYGEQGKYSFGQEMTEPPVAAPPPALIHFVDVSSTSGLPQFRGAVAPASRTRSRTNGRRAPVLRAPDAQTAEPDLAGFLGSGACVFDFDGDGHPDIFLVDADGKGDAALYRNTGKGSFVDATKSAKLEFQGKGMACAVGDYDNDGRPDLAVTSADGVRLFHNEGDGTFKEVTESAGLR